MSDQPRERYRIEVEALPSGVPATVRMKRWLKIALRAFGLKCLRCEEIPVEEE